jgi:hypothetical protein
MGKLTEGGSNPTEGDSCKLSGVDVWGTCMERRWELEARLSTNLLQISSYFDTLHVFMYGPIQIDPLFILNK